MKKKCIFISGACDQERISLLTAIINLAFKEIEAIELRLIDPIFLDTNWQIKNEEATFYTELSPQTRKNGIKEPSVLDGLCEMQEAVEERVKGIIKAKRLGKAPTKMLPSLWVVNNAENLVEKYPKNASNMEANAVDPIRSFIKLGHLIDDMIVISGKPPDLKEYGLVRADLADLNIAVWLGVENIEKAIDDITGNFVSVKQKLRKQLECLKKGSFINKYIALVSIPGQEVYITEFFLPQIGMKLSC